MTPKSNPKSGSVLAGVALGISGYGVFSLQDAAVKWLVTDYTVWQVMFVRSVTLTALLVLIARRAGLVAAARSRNKGAILLRAPLILAAWLCYYNAARELGLAELTTLYYAAPVMVILLSILFLKERVHAMRWVAVTVGFAGVVVAANPGERPDLWPAILVLIAAALWAWSSILVRQIMTRDTTLNQMLYGNGAFAIIAGCVMPWVWQTPDTLGWALMIGLGLLSGVGQYLLFEGFRMAPASAMAPTEYTSLIWAFLLGFAIWGDVPATSVFLGAGLIVLGSLVLIVDEHRRSRFGAAEPSPATVPVRPSVAPVELDPGDDAALSEPAPERDESPSVAGRSPGE